MSEAFADRKQCEPQSKYEEREPEHEEQSADKQRHQAADRSLDDENLEDGDDEYDWQQIAQAGHGVVK